MIATGNHPAIVFTPDGARYTSCNGHVIQYRKANGIYYHADTPDALVRALEQARACRQRVRIYYGDTDTGRVWLEENDVEGYIGNSLGPLKVPLLIHDRRSTGGPAILDHCIVRIKRTTGGVLYQHPTYYTGTFTIREIGPSETCHGESLRAIGYTHAVDVDGQNHANFRSLEAARHYVRKMSE